MSSQGFDGMDDMDDMDGSGGTDGSDGDGLTGRGDGRGEARGDGPGDGRGGGGRDSARGDGRAGGGGDERAAGHGDDVAEYAADVRAQFADLPEADSAELLEDLEDHLREVEAEDAGTLRERLGEPAMYARELRQAAGLPEPGEGSGAGTSAAASVSWRRALRASVRAKAAEAERRIRSYRAGREVLDFLPTLRPAWWVLRGWVAVRVLEVMTTQVDAWHGVSLVPSVGDSTFLGFLALLVAIPFSVHLGRARLSGRWRRRLVTAGEGVLILFTVGMALSSIGDGGDSGSAAWRVASDQQASMSGLVEDGKPISNLYVYDQNGKLLDGVLVYDQDGQQVSVTGQPVVDSDGWLDGNGQVLMNIYPRRVLQTQWNDSDGTLHYVAVPPPVVILPQGVHRASGADGLPQGSATSPSATAPSTAPSPTAPGSTASPTSAAPPPTSPAGPTPDGASAAHTSPAPSTLPSTPAPPGATH
jgi:hypothetical protein